MKKATSKDILANCGIPTMIVVGSSLAAFPASALELGELTVQSRLGQPLRASIAYALAPNEQLSDYCVTMRPGPSVSGLPGFGSATVSVANGVILLTGKTPVREPMISAHVVVNCPYSANLSREYMLFIEPLAIAQPVTVTVQTAPQAEPVAVAPAVVERPVAAVRAEPVRQDISTATRYRVQPSESLSMIAQRIENRSVGLWPAVNAIFAANPDAFIDNDPNRLKAGSWLSIPDFDGNRSAVTTPESSSADPDSEVSTDYEPTPLVAAVPEELVIMHSAPVAEAPAIEEPVADMTEDLRPGDIIFEARLPGPTTTSSSPNVPTAIITTRNVGTDGSASPWWLIWLAGSSIGLVIGLLMFGRRLRDRNGKGPAAALADQAPTTDTQDQNIESISVDYDLSDDSPTEENLVLDADLVIGTGLEQGATSGNSQDFGFAETTKLDIELPFEPVAQISDETDMLPPLNTDKNSILDSEVLPEDDDDYDMSVIVDATKMPQPGDVTEHDLKAVEITPADESLITENYTISKEVDYKVVEQNYEDEFTATQALNEEIARAAIDLTGHMENDSDDETTDLPMATVTELDITAQMPAQNDEISDLDDTGINEAITVNAPANDETVEMPAESGKSRS